MSTAPGAPPLCAQAPGPPGWVSVSLVAAKGHKHWHSLLIIIVIVIVYRGSRHRTHDRAAAMRLAHGLTIT